MKFLWIYALILVFCTPSQAIVRAVRPNNLLAKFETGVQNNGSARGNLVEEVASQARADLIWDLRRRNGGCMQKTD